MRRFVGSKSFTSFVALVLLAGVLAPAAQAQAQQQAQQAEIVLEVMHRWNADRAPLLRAVLDRFEEAHPGVKVVDYVFGGDLNQRLTAAWAAGIGPDIAMVNWDSGPRFGRQGTLMALDGFAQREGITFDQLIYPSIAEAIVADGLTYFLPMTINLGRHLLYYNARMFREGGLDPNAPPQTHSEWLRAARLLTRQNADGIYVQRGIDMVTNNNSRNYRLIETLVEQWGTQMFNPASTQALPDIERIVSVAEWMLDFQATLGPVHPSGAGEGRPPFENEDVAMYMGIDGDWFIFSQGSPHIELAMSALPVPDGEPLRSVLVPGWGWGIGHDTEHPELAWELLKWLSVAEQGGAWFILQQGRMSSNPEQNRNPAYLDFHPYWHVVAEVANAGMPFAQRCVNVLTGDLDRLIGGALTQAAVGNGDVRSALLEARRIFQAQCESGS